MSPYTAIISLHVIIAVLGIGLCGAIPIVARQARLAASVKTDLLESLFRYTRWSLVAIALTGALLDFAAGGGFHSSWWFRVSVALLLLAGFSGARARAALRKGFAPGADSEVALRRVQRWGLTMCTTVALITALMEAKPF
jgi:hypothetical protein